MILLYLQFEPFSHDNDPKELQSVSVLINRIRRLFIFSSAVFFINAATNCKLIVILSIMISVRKSTQKETIRNLTIVLIMKNIDEKSQSNLHVIIMIILKEYFPNKSIKFIIKIIKVYHARFYLLIKRHSDVQRNS